MLIIVTENEVYMIFTGAVRKIILYEDNDNIVCVKPSGILSQSDKCGEKSLKEYLEEYTGGKVFVVHRLDRGVGGVMVYAKNKGTAARLSDKFSQNGSGKTYLAVVCARVEKGGELNNWLLKNGRTNISKVVNKNSPGAKEGRLTYEPLAFAEKDGIAITLLKIKLFTGRHHQIRVQTANAGFPIYADTKYNKLFLRKKCNEQIGLWSYSAEIDICGVKRVFKAEPQGGVFELFDAFEKTNEL